MCHDFSDRREGRTDFFDVNPHFSWTRSCSDQLWCWACVASNWKKTCIDPKTTTFFKPGYDTLITHLPIFFFTQIPCDLLLFVVLASRSHLPCMWIVARLPRISGWLRVGFCQGNFNADNCCWGLQMVVTCCDIYHQNGYQITGNINYDKPSNLRANYFQKAQTCFFHTFVSMFVVNTWVYACHWHQPIWLWAKT